MHKGSCLCGAVAFDVDSNPPAPDACHCTACRKHSGHYFVSADVPKSAVTVRGGHHLSWYQSSKKVRRGFCSTCGSSLFWQPEHRDWIGIAMGSFDGATETQLHVHVHVSEKGDYYEISDGVPQFPVVPLRGSSAQMDWPAGRRGEPGRRMRHQMSHDFSLLSPRAVLNRQRVPTGSANLLPLVEPRARLIEILAL